MLTEDDLEQLCLGWFAEQGWEIHHGPDIAPDGSNPQRASYHDVFLTPVLTTCLQKNQPASARRRLRTGYIPYYSC